MSDGLPWYKCDPVAFNNGMIGLSLPERGAYITILNCIYVEGGPIKDSPDYFVALLSCPRKDWLTIRKRLLALGKLTLALVEGMHCLSNPRAEREIVAYEATIVKRRRGGLARAKQMGERPKHLKLVED